MAYRYTTITPLITAWPTILLISAIGLFLGVLLSFVRPLEYSSTVRILITQELGTIDAYTASLSVERISDDLADVVYTTSFYKKVLEAPYDINTAYFKENEIDRRKQWGKMITTSVSRSSGLLTIKAYHTDVGEAQKIANAVAYVLINEGWTYTSGSNIKVQLVDEALDSRWPVRPNIPVNALSGFVLGLICSVGYVLIQVERIKRRHQLIHEG
jgi:capsular polysaccharide biosynthesis protein